MHAEIFDTAETAAAIRKRSGCGRRHDVVRALETTSKGSTELFIRPPFEFHVVDVLLTNFHLPQSTLLMLVSAFASRELILNAYADAVRKRYRFFSYGDCMLFCRATVVSLPGWHSTLSLRVPTAPRRAKRENMVNCRRLISSAMPAHVAGLSVLPPTAGQSSDGNDHVLRCARTIS
jgi:hypothetical protein